MSYSSVGCEKDGSQILSENVRDDDGDVVTSLSETDL